MNPILLMVVFHGCGRTPSTMKISPLAQGAVPTSGEVGSTKVGVQLERSQPCSPTDSQIEWHLDSSQA